MFLPCFFLSSGEIEPSLDSILNRTHHNNTIIRKLIYLLSVTGRWVRKVDDRHSEIEIRYEGACRTIQLTFSNNTTPMQQQIPSIEIQVKRALDQSPHFDASKFTLRADDGHVEIRGRVRSFYQKQMAQEAIRTLSGVKEIENKLEVEW